MRVNRIHDPQRSAHSCPWAEPCSIGGKGSGSFFGQRVGDLVWVMFDAGDVDAPVIMGAQNTESLGVSDEPVSSQADYKRSLSRWSHVDRKGNLLEMSENGNESYVRLKSGSAEVRVTQIGNEIVISAPSGRISVQGNHVDVSAGVVTVKTAQLDVEAQDFSALGGDAGSASIHSNGRVEINAQGDTALGKTMTGEISIGGGAQRWKGVPIPATISKQTPKTNLRGAVVNIGGGITTPIVMTPSFPPAIPGESDNSMDVDFLTALLPTLTINIRSTMGINLNTGGTVNLRAMNNVNITSVAGFVTMSAPAMSINAQGTLTIEATGIVKIKGSAINLSAG